VAILDLDGEVVKLKSSRNFSLRNIVRFLSRECNPVLIASDVNPAPRLAEKVSTSFSVPLHTPHESLSRKAKSRLVRDFNLRGLARHKKDALAAAVSAFGSLAPMIRKVGERISGAGLSGDVSSNDVAGKIILGKYRNIETAIRELVQERGNPKALKKGNAQRARTRHSRDGYGTDW
jgi:predicted RNase H-like nuclease (RuvC/YqgF family)